MWFLGKGHDTVTTLPSGHGVNERKQFCETYRRTTQYVHIAIEVCYLCICGHVLFVHMWTCDICVCTVHENFTLLLVLCCDSDSSYSECMHRYSMVHGMGHLYNIYIFIIVDIPTSSSAKWELDPEFTCPSDCSHDLHCWY